MLPARNRPHGAPHHQNLCDHAPVNYSASLTGRGERGWFDIDPIAEERCPNGVRVA
jgi:hypothetical protein